MDIDPPVPPSSAPKKPKFTPKAPRRCKTGPVLPKSDSDDDAAGVTREYLLRKVNDRHRTRGSKFEKKTSGNVTLSSQGAGSSSTQSRTQGQPKDENIKTCSNLRDTVVKSISTEDRDTDEMLEDVEFESSSKAKNKYKEPWDPHSYYPISLPWRRPGSGNPEILNAQEFGEEEEYDENDINSAKELGLVEKDEQKKLIVLKFPPKLPLNKHTRRVPASAKGKEKAESSNSLNEDASHRCSDLKDLPNGYIGKMLVYKSGAIKLKLGDIIFDVFPGIRGDGAQEVAMMNTKSKECCVLGQVDKQAVVTPDLNSIDINQL